MFENAGKKIQFLCKINVFVTTLVSMFIGSIIARTIDEDSIFLILMGVLILGAIGFLISWFTSSFFL